MSEFILENKNSLLSLVMEELNRWNGDSIISKSIYNQSFCHHQDKHEPNKFLFKKTEYLDDLLNETIQRLNDDLLFGKVLYTYLCLPSYFSIDDYKTLLAHFGKLEYKLQYEISKIYYNQLIYCAIGNALKYEHGISNLVKLVLDFPFIKDINFKDKYGFELEDFLLTIMVGRINDITKEITTQWAGLIEDLYDTVDDYLEENVDMMYVEI